MFVQFSLNKNINCALWYKTKWKKATLSFRGDYFLNV